MAVSPAPVEVSDRFWAKVDKNGPVPAHCPDLGPCWIWTASQFTSGYGSFFIGNGHKRGAHRVAWESIHGRVPQGLLVLHHCDVRPCVNPNHLYVGTYKQNTRDRDVRGRTFSVKGENNGRAKLTALDVRDIRLAHRAGIPASVLAERYSVCLSQIHRVASSRQWSGVGVSCDD